MAVRPSQPRSLQPAVVFILALQVVGIVWLEGTPAGSVLIYSLQMTAAWLAAAYSFAALGRASGVMRYFWFLVATGFLIYGSAPAGWMIYHDWLQVAVPDLSVVGFLPFASGAFFAMALSLDQEGSERKNSAPLSWQTYLEFFQIVFVVGFICFTAYWVPAQALDSRAAVVRNAGLWLGGSLALLLIAIVRLSLSRSSHSRTLFGGMAISLAAVTISLTLAAYYIVFRPDSSGAPDVGWLGPGWSSLAWTLPLLIASNLI